jgi:hypothetical protein
VKSSEASNAGAVTGNVGSSSAQAGLGEAKLVMVKQESDEREAVKVKVLRIPPNPRLVLCAYQDGGLERRVLMRVGKNANFVRGMELKALRPARESELWGYAGALPRFKGRW